MDKLWVVVSCLLLSFSCYKRKEEYLSRVFVPCTKLENSAGLWLVGGGVLWMGKNYHSCSELGLSTGCIDAIYWFGFVGVIWVFLRVQKSSSLCL
mmetsp:Transcript_8459/g.12490  ORF Transcript_8459/g.12490 Transcript_8459/m.12490 type:complete len:95 (+) Transcript_8459:1242-1526(+)